MPNFTYTTNRPAGNITPAAQRADLETNTNSIGSILNVDMIGFNDGNGGWHKKLTLVDQVAAPGSNLNQVVEFAKSVIYPNAAGTFSELFFQRDAIATQIQMTTGPGNPVAGGTGQSYLPGGIIIKWGTDNGVGVATRTVSYSTAFPTGTFVVMAIMANNNRSLQVSATSRSNFQVTAFVGSTNNNFGGGDTFYWVAIGN